MLEQFLFAYIGGIALALAIQLAGILKARRMNKAAAEAGLLNQNNQGAGAKAANEGRTIAPRAKTESQTGEAVRLAS